MTFTQRTLPFAALALLLPAGGALLTAGPPAKPSPDRPRPVIIVTTVYPGADAAVVADTVAAPIEQQVNGVENLVSLASRSTHDGTYALRVTFEPGVDIHRAQLLVQNRVSLALPALPDAVRQAGVTVKKGPAGVLAFLALSSPDSSRDVLYLSNYATIHLKDELSRLPGVADVGCLGQRDFGMRIWLDPDRLAAHDLSAADVVKTLEEQNLGVSTGLPRVDKGPKPPLTVKALGRLADPEAFGDVILKTSAAGHLVRLKDVGRTELGAGAPQSHALLNGKPVVILPVYSLFGARPREVSAALRNRVAELRKRLPAGLDLAVAFDFTPNLEAPDRPQTPEYLLLDPTLPPSTSPERTLKTLERCVALLHTLPGVQDVLGLTENPFDFAPARPCILVRLAPADGKRAGREEITRAVRARLAEVEGITPRLRDLVGPGRFPRCGYPINLAVRGPEAGKVRELAVKLAGRLGREKSLTDVGASSASAPHAQVQLDVDRAKAVRLGVDLKDVFSTLQVYAGGAQVGDFNRFGRTWQVTVQADAGPAKQAEDFKRLKVRSDKGKMVPLGTFVTVRELNGPAVIERFDFQPMVPITANPAPGVSPAQARRLCETLADEVRKDLGLPAAYRLTWL